MDQAKWQELALLFRDEAKLMLGAKQWGCAYYLAGYAVECAFKACIVKKVAANPGIVFSSKKFSNDIYSHKPVELLILAGLGDEKTKIPTGADGILLSNWAAVKDWSEESRYARKLEADALRLYSAVADDDGVLPWIMKHWK